MRGVAGEYPLDAATTFAVGVALASWVRDHPAAGGVTMDPEVVIGMDTRESGPSIAASVAGGLASRGIKARFAGLITTPGIAHVTRSGPFAAGVMISASHNPYRDNGIKIIDHSGFKLPDEDEHVLERDIFACLDSGVRAEPAPLEIDEGLDSEYIEHLAATLPAGLAGMRIVVDAAQRVGRCHDGVSPALQPFGDPVPARGVGEGAVHQHDGWFRAMVVRLR